MWQQAEALLNLVNDQLTLPLYIYEILDISVCLETVYSDS
jgi:hypothetical protein